MPESYKWLIVHRKEKELQKWLQLAVKFNGIPMPDTKFITAVQLQNAGTSTALDEEKSEKKEKKISFMVILKNVELRRRLCLGCTIS